MKTKETAKDIRVLLPLFLFPFRVAPEAFPSEISQAEVSRILARPLTI